MVAVVGLHGGLKSGEAAVDLLVDGHVDLGRGGPEHDHALHARLLLEPADVLADLPGHVPAVGDSLDVVAVETLGVIAVERGQQGLDGLELRADGVDVLLLEHLGVESRLICVGGIHVPGREHDVVELGQRHDVLVMQVFLVCAAAHADLVILGHRSDGLGQTLAGHEHARDESRRDRSESHHHHAELALGRLCLLC